MDGACIRCNFKLSQSRVVMIAQDARLALTTNMLRFRRDSFSSAISGKIPLLSIKVYTFRLMLRILTSDILTRSMLRTRIYGGIWLNVQ